MRAVDAVHRLARTARATAGLAVLVCAPGGVLFAIALWGRR